MHKNCAYYAGIMLNAVGYLLCPKLCWHNQHRPSAHFWLAMGGNSPGLLKLFSEKCAYYMYVVCLYVCLSFRTHVSKTLFAKNSLYVRNKGHIESVLNFWAGKFWFKVVTMCQFEIRVKRVPNRLYRC